MPPRPPRDAGDEPDDAAPDVRAGADADAGMPLARLFAIAFRALLDRVHERLAEHGYEDVGPTFGYVLLAARDRPLTGADVAELMSMTKQAASKLVDSMEATGYLERRAHPGDARAKLLRITRRGKALLATVERIYAELEAEWARELGARALETLRGDLLRALRAMHGGALPPVRPGR
jgi:DNA-binding MarR family transcriptional regulator